MYCLISRACIFPSSTDQYKFRDFLSRYQVGIHTGRKKPEALKLYLV